MTEFIGQFVVRGNVRPRRIGYLVESGSRSQSLSAMRYAASEWGGIAQPIIPITPARGMSPGLMQLCDLLEPEVFIDYAGVPESIKTDIQLRYGAQVLDEASLKHYEPGLHVLAAVPEEGLESHVDVPADTESLAQTAALGSTWESDEEAWMGSGLRLNRVSSPALLLYAQTRDTSEIGITRSQLTEFESEVGIPAIVAFCFKKPTVRQLLWFWNVRALSSPHFGSKVLLIDPSVLADASIGAQLRELAMRKQATTPDLVLIGSDRAALSLLGRKAGFKLLPRGSRASTRFAATRERDLSEEPLTYAVNIHPGPFVAGRRFSGVQTQQTVAVTAPKTTLHFTSSVRFRRAFGGYLRLEFGGLDPFEWPHHSSVAQLVHPNASYSRFGIGFVTNPADRFQFELSTPQPADVIAAILHEHGWSWRLSDKGRYAQALSGSLSGNEALAAFATPQALNVVRSLMSLSRPKAQQAIRGGLRSSRTDELLNETLDRVILALSPRWRSLVEVASDVRSTNRYTLSVLEHLLNERLVIRGFRFECPGCGLNANLPLGSEADFVICEGCGIRSLLRARDREPVLVYSLNTLLDRVMDQDCLGHLLTARWLANIGRSLWSVPGADVTESSTSSQREVDVLGLSPREMLVGEVKASARRFTPNVVKSMAVLANQLGATTLVLAALDEWVPDDQSRAERQIAKNGLRALIAGSPQLLGG